MVTLSLSSTPKTSFDFNLLASPFPLYLSRKEGVVPTQRKLMPQSKEAEEAEIGVFGAEKYFNGDMDSDKSPRLTSLATSEVYSQPKCEMKETKKSQGTPSVRSESSWNSQSVLLQSKYGKNNIPTTLRKMRLFANLKCKCICFDRNSVDVDENCSAKRNPNPGLRTKALSISLEEEEVLEKKFAAVLPWKTSWARGKEGEEENESGSDESWDLFEIGSFTRRPEPFLARQVSDPSSPTCYAPSEVSIEWSVVTESAADFSVMSECATSPVRKRSVEVPRIIHNSKSQRRRSSSGILMSCKSQKSVRVSGDSYRTMNNTSNYVPRFPRGKMTSH